MFSAVRGCVFAARSRHRSFDCAPSAYMPQVLLPLIIMTFFLFRQGGKKGVELAGCADMVRISFDMLRINTSVA